MSPETLNAALDAWQRGDLGSAIAARLGVNASTLRVYVQRARKAGDPRAVWRGQGRRRGSYDEARRALYAAAHRDGLSPREAAARLAVSSAAVYAMWQRMGLPARLAGNPAVENQRSAAAGAGPVSSLNSGAAIQRVCGAHLFRIIAR